MPYLCFSLETVHQTTIGVAELCLEKVPLQQKQTKWKSRGIRGKRHCTVDLYLNASHSSIERKIFCGTKGHTGRLEYSTYN